MYKIEREVNVALSSEDGGTNINTTNNLINIEYSEEFGQVVLQGLNHNGVLTLVELESIVEDMKYVESKDLE